MLKLNTTSQLTRSERKRLIASSQHSQLFKRRTSPPFDILVSTTTKKHNKMKESPHPVKAQNVSFPVRTFPGTACPGPRDSLLPPLPSPSPAGTQRFCHQIHSKEIQRLIAHVVCLIAIRSLSSALQL